MRPTAASPQPARRRQRGAAVLLALLVVTLATFLVADLFWRQFVLYRTAENQQMGAQARLLLGGAQAWARVILQDSSHPGYDALSDPWAQPLAPTHLDQLGEESPLLAEATIEGGIQDAQGRLNLRNLVDGGGNVNPVQLAALEKLAGLLSAPTGTARLIANYVAQSYINVPAPPGGGTPAGPGSSAAAASTAAAALAGAGTAAPLVPLGSGTRPLPPVLPEDLAGIPGIDPGAALALAPFVVLLDQSGTTVNFNTAAPQVMAAVIPELSLSDANTLAAERDRAYFVSVGDILNRLHGRGGNFSLAGVSTNSSYFIVEGTAHLDRAAVHMRSLLHRLAAGPQGRVDVLWERED
jgi:general secretion pathway protein K